MCPLRPRPVQPARRLIEGDAVGGFEVLEVRGHTHGSLAFWRASDRVLISGDAAWHVLPRRCAPVPAGFGCNDRVAQRSFEQLVALEHRVVGFGHGQPLRDPGEVARAFGG
jgi:hydroxyacylglutathione hydrolase